MLQISKNFVLFRTTDEDGNYLVHCLTRMGYEQDDLLRLKELSGKTGSQELRRAIFSNKAGQSPSEFRR
jgi:hypothetical protein